jgi:hypothetical protein
MNYILFGGLLNLHYAYIDTNDYLADSLFYKRKIPVRFKEEMVRNDTKYKVVFCKIQKKYKKPFEEALEELTTKMCLFGHNDYEEFCKGLINEIEAEEK